MLLVSLSFLSRYAWLVTLCFEQKHEKYQNFYLKIFSFLVVTFSIYLITFVFVMCSLCAEVFGGVFIYKFVPNHVFFFVPREGCVSWFWNFLGVFTYMFTCQIGCTSRPTPSVTFFFYWPFQGGPSIAALLSLCVGCLPFVFLFLLILIYTVMMVRYSYLIYSNFLLYVSLDLY